MLTEERLKEISGRRGWVNLGNEDRTDLLSHIAALSATIKRLEIPVADKELEECERYHRNAMLDDSEYNQGLCAAYESVLPVCRRQAREIERWRGLLDRVLNSDNAIDFGQAERAGRAALSLNSVETREIKP